MIIMCFGCTAIHNKALNKCIIHSFIQLRTRNGGYNSHRLHQNWTIEDWKNVAWSDESRFLLRHSDVGSELGVKNMKAWIILSCLNGSGWWLCNGVRDIFLAHFVPLSTN